MNAFIGRFGLNITAIKMIAIVLMVCDHIHQMFAPAGAPLWLTWLGRPVMIMFLFAVAESFYYTRSRRNYLLRLLAGSTGMMLVSYLLETVLLPNDNIVLMNNAFGAFFVAALYMLAWDILLSGIKERKALNIAGALLLSLAPVLTALPLLLAANIEMPAIWLSQAAALITLLIPNILTTEGGPFMVLIGLLFYILRRWRWTQIAVLAAFSALIFIAGGGESVQWMMAFAAIPMALYNGEKGRGLKYFFYIFYPAHIYLLYCIATLWK